MPDTISLHGYQLTALAHGIDRADVNADGVWIPHRLPIPLADLFDSNENRRRRIDCPACVRLRFKSNTPRLAIALRYRTGSRPKGQSALMVDGELVNTFGVDEPEPYWSGEIFTSDGDQMRTFDLWLPHMRITEVESLTIDEGSRLEPIDGEKVQWLVLGDSITQGMNASLPTSTYPARVALELGIALHNVGVGGVRCEEGLPNAIPDGRYHVASIALGTNDFFSSVPLANFKRWLDETVKAIAMKHHDLPVVIIGTPPSLREQKETEQGYTIEDFRQAAREVAESNEHASYLPGETLFPAEKMYVPDGVHPSDEGFAEYARAVAPAIKAAYESYLARH